MENPTKGNCEVKDTQNTFFKCIKLKRVYGRNDGHSYM